MFTIKENLNKFNLLVLISILLFITVIGQSIYITKIYSKPQNVLQKENEVLQLNEPNNKLSKQKSTFGGFDNEFMINHFKEFRKIKEQMDKTFDNAFAEFNMHSGFNDDFINIFESSKTTDDLNFTLQDKNDEFTITLKLPDSQKNNVNVKLEGQKLIVSGDVKKQIEESNDSGRQYREYSSVFSRSIILPEKVKENSLTTKFENENLVITILKEGAHRKTGKI